MKYTKLELSVAKTLLKYPIHWGEDDEYKLVIFDDVADISIRAEGIGVPSNLHGLDTDGWFSYNDTTEKFTALFPENEMIDNLISSGIVESFINPKRG